MRPLITPDRLLSGLEAIAQTISQRPEALALLALGSCGLARDRLDAFSDLDFFVIVEAHAKAVWIENLDWLTTGSPLVFAHRNTRDGWKTLDRDGVFCEFAVFHPAELAAIPFCEGRIVWSRDGFETTALVPSHPASMVDPAWLTQEALTNVLVGLKRLLRGEFLAAHQAICVHAADHVCALLVGQHKADAYNPWRRLEACQPDISAALTNALSYDDPALTAQELVTLIGNAHAIPDALGFEIKNHLDHYHARR
jgi:lincosamide nucleotidyltransferase B/F